MTGRLSTHVLDVQSGCPAAGVGIELWELSQAGPPRLLVATSSNRGGRTDKPLIAERPVPIGTYELRFAVSSYFAGRGVCAAGSAVSRFACRSASPSPSRKATITCRW